MGKHQIIYTSCMRGINSVNDGQQVFSYDADFPDYKRDDVKSLFTYQHPALSPGAVMSEALALTMPQTFMYRRLDNKMIAITLNTYIGRDYMGDTGRFGNHLSHSIICDEAELSHYPCEFYGSDMLRNHMKYEEVNNSERPSYLPTPELITGPIINIEVITDFLSEGNRLEIYKNMLAAMLAYDSERKRLVICDEPANIIKWIAALEYALPLKNAVNIDFTTYEYDPSLSISRICGVVPQGTRFATSHQDQHFVFNMFEEQYPEVELVDSEFYEFIDMSMSFSYDSLQAFHEFLNASYQYKDIDVLYYDAYQLYELRMDGMRGISPEEFQRATAFALKYAEKNEFIALVEQLSTERDVLLHLEHTYFLSVFMFILESYDQLSFTMQNAVRELVAERIIRNFVSDTSDEASFTRFYRDVDHLCQTKNFSIAVELMKDENGTKLFNAMQQGVAQWKTVFIVKVLCDYVKRDNVVEDELLVEGAIGNVFYDIIKGAYLDQATNGIYIANYILEEFAEHYVYLMNMMFNIEGMLIELQDGEAAVQLIWKHFMDIAISQQKNKCLVISKFFGSYERHERVYEIYESLLKNTTSAEEGRIIYKQHMDAFCLINSKYAAAYLPDILSVYYKHIRKHQDEHTPKDEVEVLATIMQHELQPTFVDELIKSVLSRISLESPNRKTYEFIQSMYVYNDEVRKQVITGNLLLLVVGILIEQSLESFDTTMQHIQRITKGKQIDLTSLGMKSSKSYYSWILPHICSNCVTADEMFEICHLFRMNDEDLVDYVMFCSKHYLQVSKDKKNYKLFCEFLKFLFKVDHADLQVEIGKQLSRLRNNDLEQLNDIVIDFFREDRKALRSWKGIYDVAESTNPLLSNITNFFKRK